MPDVVDPATRSRMMSGIGSKDTVPEIVIRRALHKRGFRFRLHRKDLPGKPDLVLTKYGTVIHINGCFWHGHDCSLFRMPQTRQQFWEGKIQANQARDKRNTKLLSELGWRQYFVWECALKGPDKIDVEDLVDEFENWLRSSEGLGSVAGRTMK